MAITNGWYVTPGKLSARHDKMTIRAVTARFQDYINGLGEDLEHQEGEPPTEARGVLVSGHRGENRELFYFVMLGPHSDAANLEEFARTYSPAYAAARAERRAAAPATWELDGETATARVSNASLQVYRTKFGNFQAMVDRQPGSKMSSPLPSFPPDRMGFVTVIKYDNGVEFPAWLNDEKDWLSHDTLEELTEAVTPEQLCYSITGIATTATAEPRTVDHNNQRSNSVETVNGWQVRNEIASRKGRTMNYRAWQQDTLPGTR